MSSDAPSVALPPPTDPVACYERTGTTMVAAILNAHEVASLQTEAQTLITARGVTGSPGGTWPEAGPALRAALCHERVVATVCALLKVTQVRTASWQLLPWQPGGATTWHRDEAHVPLTGDRVGVWLPVLPRPEGTGLHYRPLDGDGVSSMTWLMQPGDVSFHSPTIEHTSWPSSVPTLGLATYFFPDGHTLQVAPPNGTPPSQARLMLARTTFAGLRDGDVIEGDRFPLLTLR